MMSEYRIGGTAPVLPQLARFLADPEARESVPDWMDFATSAMSVAAMENRWHYVSFLCAQRLSSISDNAERNDADQAEGLIRFYIANHRISEALHLRMLVDQGRNDLPPFDLPKLPARRWNLPNTDFWVDLSTVTSLLESICTKADRIHRERRTKWIDREVRSQFKALNDRLKDGALWRLMRHAGALNGMQWRRLTKDSKTEVVHLRIHYATAWLTVSIRVGSITARHQFFLHAAFEELIGEEERQLWDSHFGPRLLSSAIYAILYGIRSRMPLDALTPNLQALYAKLLAPLLLRPDVLSALGKLGHYPTLVISTHGVLAQFPFAALHDGNGFLAEKFNIVQAPLLYPEEELGTGDIDFDALTGGTPLTGKSLIRVLADVEGLPETEKEIASYRFMKNVFAANIEVGPAGMSRDWSVETLQWLFEGDISVLSSHIRASVRDPNSSTVVTPSKAEIAFQDLLVPVMKSRLIVLAGCDSQGQTDWFGAGEGSIASLFRRRGVETVVSTLWSVSDLAARLYNEALIDALRRGQGRAQAHGEAQRAVMQATADCGATVVTERRACRRQNNPASGGEQTASRQFDHPYFWAGFTLSGAWR